MDLICITGIDGSGKTTLAKNLVSILRIKGINARYIYGRTIPVISRVLMYFGRRLILPGQTPWKDYSIYSTNKRKVMKNPFLRFFYKASIWIDYYIQIWSKLFPYFFGKRIVILDRYVYDTVISDLAVHLDYQIDDAMHSIDLGMKLLPLPKLTIVVDISEEVAFSRKTDVASIDYLRERRPFYQALNSRSEVRVIDGKFPKEKVFAKASDLIKSSLGLFI